MSRRSGLIILLVSIVVSVLLAWALRTPSPTFAGRDTPTASDPARASINVVPNEARPAVIRDNEFAGGAPPAPAGFDATVSAVLREQILDTDLSPEDIPPLETPATVGSSSPAAPANDEIVIGVVVDGKARAYPVSVLNYHWAVNDVVDGRAVVILWDPLAGAAAVYQARAGGQPIKAGASGKCYQGNALFYDRESTSLFPAITGRFVTGPLTNRRLQPLAFRREDWGTWRERYQNTRVLSPETGFERDYATNPFASVLMPDGSRADYAQSAALLVPPTALEDPPRLPLKEWVVGFVEPGTQPQCCAIEELPADGEPVKLGRALVSRQQRDQAHVTLSGGVWPQQTVCYYFAWVGLHPDTDVWPTTPTTTQ